MRLLIALVFSWVLMPAAAIEIDGAAFSPTLTASSGVQQPQPQPQPPGGKDLNVDVDVNRGEGGGAWYTSPMWLAIGGLAVLLLVILLVVAARGGGGTTVIRD